MTSEQIKALIEAGLPGAEARVAGDGRHFEAIVICDAFAHKTMLQQHRMVYAALGDKMATEEIHALSMRTYTRDEWNNSNP